MLGRLPKWYENDSILNGYVMTLQKFEQLLKEKVAIGNVTITGSTIETNIVLDLWNVLQNLLMKCWDWFLIVCNRKLNFQLLSLTVFTPLCRNVDYQKSNLLSGLVSVLVKLRNCLAVSIILLSPLLLCSHLSLGAHNLSRIAEKMSPFFSRFLPACSGDPCKISRLCSTATRYCSGLRHARERMVEGSRNALKGGVPCHAQ